MSRPAQQTVLTVTTTFAALNPTAPTTSTSTRPVTAGYDRVVMVPTAAGKDGSQAAANLTPRTYSAVKLSGADGLIGTAAGESAGFYVDVTDLAPDLSKFGLYFTSVTRPNAHCATAACDALPAGAPGEDQLAKYIADNLPPAIFGDFAPEEAGLIDEDTWYAQTVGLNQAYDLAVFNYVLKTLQPDTDVLLAGTDQTDEVSHQILGLLTPTAPDDTANPYYDRVAGTGPRDQPARPARRVTSPARTTRPTPGSGFVRSAARRRRTSWPPATTASHRSGTPSTLRSCSSNSGLQDVEQTGNCRPAAASAPGGTIAKAC